MEKIYEIKIFNLKFFLRRKDDNTIGNIWETLEKAKTNKGKSYAIAVNSEIFQDGKSIGWIKSQKEIETIKEINN